jgi:SOS-response transcriptional repressor LexA
MDAPRAPLTQVERKVYHFLIDYLAEHTFQPSVREIARHFRIPSTKTVTDLIAAIAEKK